MAASKEVKSGVTWINDIVEFTYTDTEGKERVETEPVSYPEFENAFEAILHLFGSIDAALNYLGGTPEVQKAFDGAEKNRSVVDDWNEGQNTAARRASRKTAKDRVIGPTLAIEKMATQLYEMRSKHPDPKQRWTKGECLAFARSAFNPETIAPVVVKEEKAA